MARRAVQVVSQVEVARLLVDPVKRQILRHLGEKQLTQKMLGELLGMADPSVYYHLKELRAARLVRVVRSEAEAHGIIQKFYEADAQYFVVDYGAVPLELRRHLLAVNLERLRGVFAIKALKGARVTLSSVEMEKVADRMAYFVSEAARRYQALPASGDRESLIVNLYGDAILRAIEADPAGMEPLTSQLSALGLTNSRRGSARRRSLSS